MNSDVFQHVYSFTVAAGDAYAGSPAGTFVSWEDRGPGGDWDYNDDTFIFTGVTPSVLTSGVPEASTWAMMLAVLPAWVSQPTASERSSTGSTV